MLEVDRWEELPWGPALVRRKGRAVAAYIWREEAEAHAAPLEDGSVWTDSCVGLVKPPHWRIDRAQEQRARSAVDTLAAFWLAGGNNLPAPLEP